MHSPGRPGVNQRETKQAFWKCIAEGMPSEAAALACKVSQPLGPRWFREAGGIAPISLAPPSGRYLSFAEREELALLRAGRHGVREMARRLGRSPSTVSRELRRKAATRGGT
ncbi:integrase catalytic region, partial [mine drainage metagenome]